jgi:hypothetical protein
MPFSMAFSAVSLIAASPMPDEFRRHYYYYADDIIDTYD